MPPAAVVQNSAGAPGPDNKLLVKNVLHLAERQTVAAVPPDRWRPATRAA